MTVATDLLLEATGIAKTAPRMPKNWVPARIARKTVIGVKPTAPRMMRGPSSMM